MTTRIEKAIEEFKYITGAIDWTMIDGIDPDEVPDWTGLQSVLNLAPQLAETLESILEWMTRPLPAFNEADPDGREYGQAMFDLAKAEVEEALATWKAD